MMWPSRVVILSSWLLTRIISHLWKKCLWFVWRWSISGSHVDFKVLVTDAIAGLCLEEGSTFKSGQQVAEACFPKQIVSCLSRHKQMPPHENDDKGEDNYEGKERCVKGEIWKSGGPWNWDLDWKRRHSSLLSATVISIYNESIVRKMQKNGCGSVKLRGLNQQKCAMCNM